MTKFEFLKIIPQYCKLSGSRKFGNPTKNSDYDFFVPENKWETFKKWFFENVPQDIEIGSIVIYSLYCRFSNLHSDLIEFSPLFPTTKEEYDSRRNS